MRVPTKKRRGIVMMIALLTLLVITMIVAAAATAMPVQLFAATHGGETQAAFLAARSGVDYAHSRLQQNRQWMGNGDTAAAGPHMIVNTPQLQVVEDTGNVIGVMVNGDGSRSAFRFKFNYQNGGSTSPDDGFPDPNAAHLISNQYLCYNNIGQSLNIDTYQANPNTGVVINTVTGVLAKFNAEIQVEGLAGPGLNTATVANLDALVNAPATRSRIYSQRIATRFNIAGTTQVDCVVAAASAFTGSATDVAGEIKVVEAPNVSAPKLRTRTTADTLAGTYTTTGEVRVDDLAGSTMTGVTPIQESATLQDAHFLRVKTSQVQKATAADTRLKAGTYVWRPNGPNYQLEYYAQNFNGTIPTGPPTDVMSNPGDYGRFISNGSGITFDFNNMGANIDNKVFIDPQSAGSVKDLAILIEPGLQSVVPIRPTANFLDTGNPAILSASGNITMQGSMDGYGGVTSDQDILFQGASAFETDPMNAICIYAGGNITVQAIPDSVVTNITTIVPSGVGMGMGKKVGYKSMGGMSSGTVAGTTSTAFTASAGDVSLTGIIYALGDFNLDLTTSALPGNHGNFFMEGVLTAYGGNPDAGDLPGTNGNGRVSIKAKNTELYYDPSYLMQLQGNGGTAPINLTQVSWNVIP